MNKTGVVCAGNWIIDQVKFVDSWPKKGELTNIVSESYGAGGSPFNILIDLAHINVSFPTFGVGCIGNDTLGKTVIEMCEKEGLSSGHLTVLPNASTSYTDVMMVQKTGERTFFHQRGANANFAPKHIPLELLDPEKIEIFHLGYLLLLDEFDEFNSNGETKAAEFLKECQKKGVKTSIDIVSEASERAVNIVTPSLPYVNYLIINEVEAGNIVSKQLRHNDESVDIDAVKEAARKLKELGVNDVVLIHFPEGAVWYDKDDNLVYRESLSLPENFIVGSVGAGDAFCAGALVGIKEKMSPVEVITFASGMAAACLSASNTTDGIKSREYVNELISKFSKKC